VILKVVKQQGADGSIRVARSNVYNKVVPFVAFTKLDGEAIKGTQHPMKGRLEIPVNLGVE